MTQGRFVERAKVARSVVAVTQRFASRLAYVSLPFSFGCYLNCAGSGHSLVRSPEPTGALTMAETQCGEGRRRLYATEGELTIENVDGAIPSIRARMAYCLYSTYPHASPRLAPDTPASCFTQPEARLLAQHLSGQPIITTEGRALRLRLRLPTFNEWSCLAGPEPAVADVCTVANVRDLAYVRERWAHPFDARYVCNDGTAMIAGLLSYPSNSNGLRNTWGNLQEWVEEEGLALGGAFDSRTLSDVEVDGRISPETPMTYFIGARLVGE